MTKLLTLVLLVLNLKRMTHFSWSKKTEIKKMGKKTFAVTGCLLLL